MSVLVRRWLLARFCFAPPGARGGDLQRRAPTSSAATRAKPAMRKSSTTRTRGARRKSRCTVTQIGSCGSSGIGIRVSDGSGSPRYRGSTAMPAPCFAAATNASVMVLTKAGVAQARVQLTEVRQPGREVAHSE